MKMKEFRKAQVRGWIQRNSPSLNIPWNTGSSIIMKREGTAGKSADCARRRRVKEATKRFCVRDSEVSWDRKLLGHQTKHHHTLYININVSFPLWSIMVAESWGCFPAADSGWLENEVKYMRILKKNLIHPARNLQPRRKCFQQDRWAQA